MSFPPAYLRRAGRAALVMGFGGKPDKALTGPMQKILDGGFFQSVRLCVDKIGFAANRRSAPRKSSAVATGRSTRRSA